MKPEAGDLLALPAGPASPTELEQRVLARLATAKDARAASSVLERAGIFCRECADIAEMLREMQHGVGALMLAEETLTGPGAAELLHALAAQPPWSDVPVLVLARQGAHSNAIRGLVEAAVMPNLTVVERPVRVAPLITALRSMLRARGRQLELRDVLEGLHEADRRKNEFLATLAHELRNPLAPISTALALLSDARVGAAEQPRIHAMLRRQLDHMVRLVDDLMEVSRITRGKVDLQRAPLEAAAVLGDAVELSRPAIEGRGHRLVVDLPSEPLALHGDAVRLTQVFCNLLNNAAKYTPAGGRITLAARREGAQAAVSVSDDGIGLAATMLAPIFDMFVQAGDSARPAQGGLGIGLTLAKTLVEMHGGSIEAASEGPGRGATFTVRLPLSAADARGDGVPAAAGPAAARPALPRSVLVVDDNRDAADSLVELLRGIGTRAEGVYDAQQALQAAHSHDFDAAVLDIGLPGMDGCELARKLRERQRAPLKLIALTGWGQDRDRERIAAAGFDRHLLKPVEPAQLMEALGV
ncbi:MAG TPA: response regulator [Methylibium sp.]|uniref:hybrid sensor histidine kinase/response regulator n=1 Tax=Methylibium sp. TaxID=2067992 RepID=UPI002DC02210|nr:response regulator [Methylibium sp.]HEU4457631.1 response regulator [Methylibium sp.]